MHLIAFTIKSSVESYTHHPNFECINFPLYAHQSAYQSLEQYSSPVWFSVTGFLKIINIKAKAHF